MYVDLKENERLKNIVDKIIKDNPTGCLAYNHKSNDDWVDTESVLDEFVHSQNYGLNICGCGSTELVLEIIWKILSEQKRYKEADAHSDDTYVSHRENLYSICGYTNKDESSKDNQLYQALIEFVLKILDSKGFLEHGGMAWNGWLTQKGEDFLYVLDLYIKELEDK